MILIFLPASVRECSASRKASSISGAPPPAINALKPNVQRLTDRNNRRNVTGSVSYNGGVPVQKHTMAFWHTNVKQRHKARQRSDMREIYRSSTWKLLGN